MSAQTALLPAPSRPLFSEGREEASQFLNDGCPQHSYCGRSPADVTLLHSVLCLRGCLSLPCKEPNSQHFTGRWSVTATNSALAGQKETDNR